MTAAQAKNAVKASVCRCDPLVLRERIPTLRSLSDFTELERQTIAERIELASVCPEELWSRLESLFRDQDETGCGKFYDGMDSICEALARHAPWCTDRVLAIISEDAEDFWPRGIGVELAGVLRLQAAVPQLVSMLYDDDIWVFEECRFALAKIGTDDVVRRLHKRYPSASCGYRDLVRGVLARIYLERSVATRLELAQQASHRSERGELLASALKHFAAQAVEPARQFVLQAPLDDVGLTVRRSLLIGCNLMGIRFAEFDAWLEDSRTDDERREEWIAQRMNCLTPEGRSRVQAASAALAEALRVSLSG